MRLLIVGVEAGQISLYKIDQRVASLRSNTLSGEKNSKEAYVQFNEEKVGLRSRSSMLKLPALSDLPRLSQQEH